MKEKKIDILIPTYNRSKNLRKNMEMLSSIIYRNQLADQLNIIVSDNCSSDRTRSVIKRFEENFDFIHGFVQKKNLGLKRNVLFCLEQAVSEYVMYLGDDDYLNVNYLKRSLKHISEINNLSCILPSIKAIKPNGEPTGYLRDSNLSKKFHKKGFDNCLINSWRGHQLSGVTFKREGTIEEYNKRKVDNIYPFIFFVAFNCLRGNTINLIEYPVQVTQVPQSKKDWNYNVDGLIGEINDNYKKLRVNYFYKVILQIALLNNQKWRYIKFLKKKETIKFYRSLVAVVKGKNTLLLVKVASPLLMHYNMLLWLIKKYFRDILND